jgi:isopentenyl diphosphate isomerase/L-lactate dehydrogenase-like FMN-dependent dehydrogenase
MGVDSQLPIFISPAAMAKLGHPLGEVNLTKGAGECGIVQGISINASCSLDEIMEARKEGQKVFFQAGLFSFFFFDYLDSVPTLGVGRDAGKTC